MLNAETVSSNALLVDHSPHEHELVESEMLKIDIRSLKAGVHELDVTTDLDEVEIEDARFSDIRLKVRIDVNGQRLYVVVNASAIATLICDRTAVEFEHPVKGSFSVVYMPPNEIDSENEDESLQPLTAEMEEIDLTNIVRDTLLLSVPIRKIAPGATDLDIPTSFGEASESDVDPRWSALAKLRPESEGKTEQ